MIGVYQCYCIQQGLFGTLSSEDSDNCNFFYFKWLGGHGVLVKLFGIIIGLMNNLTFFIVKFIGAKLRFKRSTHRSAFVMLATFMLSYMNSSLIATFMIHRIKNHEQK